MNANPDVGLVARCGDLTSYPLEFERLVRNALLRKKKKNNAGRVSEFESTERNPYIFFSMSSFSAPVSSPHKTIFSPMGPARSGRILCGNSHDIPHGIQTSHKSCGSEVAVTMS